jgi:hypothetical protein
VPGTDLPASEFTRKGVANSGDGTDPLGGNREEGLPMVRRLLDGEEPWAYENRASVLEWAQDHVVVSVAAAVTIWFGVIYAMTLVAGVFS